MFSFLNAQIKKCIFNLKMLGTMNFRTNYQNNIYTDVERMPNIHMYISQFRKKVNLCVPMYMYRKLQTQNTQHYFF